MKSEMKSENEIEMKQLYVHIRAENYSTNENENKIDTHTN
jgi:hypothetical protein